MAGLAIAAAAAVIGWFVPWPGWPLLIFLVIDAATARWQRGGAKN